MSVTLEGVSLHVADVERSIDFYSRIPGAEKMIHRPGQFARFRIGTGYLHVVQISAGRGFHIEMGADDLHVLYDELKAAGIETDGKITKRPWGKTDLRVLDPDGNILEFDAPE